MNTRLLLMVAALLMVACSSAPNKNTLSPVDLTADKNAVSDYWLVYRKVTAPYPEAAKSQKLSGCVEFTLVIDSLGQAVEPKITKSFPAGVFDQQALSAIKNWLWVPAQANTERRASIITLQQDFVIRQSSNSKAVYDACKI